MGVIWNWSVLLNYNTIDGVSHKLRLLYPTWTVFVCDQYKIA